MYGWIKAAIVAELGYVPERIILTGSRARGAPRPDSDWDVLIVDEKAKSIWPHGPLRLHNKLTAPDGNALEFFLAHPSDLEHPLAQTNQFVRDAIALGIDL